MKARIGVGIYWLFCIIALMLIFAADGGSYPDGYYSLVVRGAILYLIGRDIRNYLTK